MPAAVADGILDHDHMFSQRYLQTHCQSFSPFYPFHRQLCFPFLLILIRVHNGLRLRSANRTNPWRRQHW